MPELPEVEVLVRHLAPLLVGRRVQEVSVRRPKTIRPHAEADFVHRLQGAQFTGLERRGKYLVFSLRAAHGGGEQTLLGHLGMTGRMHLVPVTAAWPRHWVVALGLGRPRLIFEDPRGFGRLTFACEALERLGPEPLDGSFTPATLAAALRPSRQAIKVRLMDQGVVAGLGNIYASEVLFRARLSPRRRASELRPAELRRLHRAIRMVLAGAIRWGSTVPLDWAGTAGRDRLFYYGHTAGAPGQVEERLAVYGRAGRPCRRCGSRVRKFPQAGRSTFYCPRCQAG